MILSLATFLIALELIFMTIVWIANELIISNEKFQSENSVSLNFLMASLTQNKNKNNRYFENYFWVVSRLVKAPSSSWAFCRVVVDWHGWPALNRTTLPRKLKQISMAYNFYIFLKIIFQQNYPVAKVETRIVHFHICIKISYELNVAKKLSKFIAFFVNRQSRNLSKLVTRKSEVFLKNFKY